VAEANKGGVAAQAGPTGGAFSGHVEDEATRTAARRDPFTAARDGGVTEPTFVAPCSAVMPHDSR